MSINWVMLSPSTTPPFTPLPNEQCLFTSPPRIGFTITTPAHNTNSAQPPYSLSHPSGILYLTSRRIIYIPDKPTEKLKSFAAPILNLHDSRVTAPFFGPNVWMALLHPVQGGHIPVPATGVVDLKLTFKDGGAFDFHTRYVRVRERLQQAVEVSRSDADGPRSGANGLNVSNVNLDDLPAYQEQSDGPLLAPLASAMQTQQQAAAASRPSAGASNPPDEPPPGYEETQLAGVHEAAERQH